MSIESRRLQPLKDALDRGDLDGARTALERLERRPAATELMGAVSHQGDRVPVPVKLARSDGHYQFTFTQGQRFELACDELRAALDQMAADKHARVDCDQGYVYLTRRWFGEMTVRFPGSMTLYQDHRHGRLRFAAALDVRLTQAGLRAALDWADEHDEDDHGRP